jgi:hypothetical protein
MSALRFIFMVVVLVACREDPESVCPFVENRDNCWRKLVTAIEACAGERTRAAGKLAADGSACTYEDGAQITFRTPLDLSTSDAASGERRKRDFVLTVGGKTCMEVLFTGREITVTGPTGTVRAKTDAEKNAIVSCPDGTTVSGTSSPDGFGSCEILPGFPNAITRTEPDLDSFHLGASGSRRAGYECRVTCLPPNCAP